MVGWVTLYGFKLEMRRFNIGTFEAPSSKEIGRVFQFSSKVDFVENMGVPLLVFEERIEDFIVREFPSFA